MIAADLLPSLDGVRSRGHGKWSAKCPAHHDQSPSLSVHEGERAILMRCFAGCTLSEITTKLGIHISDLFYNPGVSDPAARQKARDERIQQQAAKRAAWEATSRHMDTLREAEAVARSAKGISITGWSDAKLDGMLGTIADAYERLWEESHEWR